MTYDVMMMLSSDVMLYHIFITERICLPVLGLWLGVLIDYVVWDLYGNICGSKICKVVTL
jgi:hypothetical protein